MMTSFRRFHTYDYARHFVSACTRILGLEGTPEGVEDHGRLTRVAAVCISLYAYIYKSSSTNITYFKLFPMVQYYNAAFDWLVGYTWSYKCIKYVWNKLGMEHRDEVEKGGESEVDDIVCIEDSFICERCWMRVGDRRKYLVQWKGVKFIFELLEKYEGSNVYYKYMLTI